jgi:peptidoglycan/LPS O-acetylase OafA/YrhL
MASVGGIASQNAPLDNMRTPLDPAFRPDIEGLRALAILPILACHLGVAGFTGGFIGVDIFFVISGYLITGTLLAASDPANGQSIATTLWNFYHRRLVRILPALTVMLATVLILACLIMLPGEIRQSGMSAAAAAGFVANIFFWKTTPYFDRWAEVQPLLHTWSLGVEEQFYLFYPIFLLGCVFGSRRWTWFIIISAALGSFLLCWFLTYRAPIAAFYLLPSRGWELLAGGVLCLLPRMKIDNRLLINLAAYAGILMIGYAIWALTPDSPFPGPNALYPVIGTLLLITFGRDSQVAIMLTNTPMRWIGRVSYSLYLWHWPLIVFYRMQFGTILSAWEMALLFGAALLMAGMSYSLVERPSLIIGRKLPMRRVFASGFLAIGASIAAGLWVSSNAGHWRAYPQPVVRVLAFQNYLQSRQWQKQTRSGLCHRTLFNIETCYRPSPGKRNILLIGDSHAAMMARALDHQIGDAKLLQATADGCPPLIDAPAAPACQRLQSLVKSALRSKPMLDQVIIIGRWEPADLPHLTATIGLIQRYNVPVLVVGPFPRYQQPLPRLLAMALLYNDDALLDREFFKTTGQLDRQVEQIALDNGARFYSPYRLLCPKDKCRRRLDDGSPVQFDTSHLTQKAADYIANSIPVM